MDGRRRRLRSCGPGEGVAVPTRGGGGAVPLHRSENPTPPNTNTIGVLKTSADPAKAARETQTEDNSQQRISWLPQR